MQNNEQLEGFNFENLLPILAIGAIAYFMIGGGGVSISTKTSEQKAQEYEQKAEKYKKLADALREIAAKEEELKSLKESLKTM